MRPITFLLSILVVLGTVAVDAAADNPLPTGTLTLAFTEFSNTDLAVSAEGGAPIHIISAIPGDSWNVDYVSLFQGLTNNQLIPGSFPNIGVWNESDGSYNKIISGPHNSVMFITSEDVAAGAAVPVANGVQIVFVGAIDEESGSLPFPDNLTPHNIAITFNDLSDTGLVGVPEPSTLSLLAVGLAGLGYGIRRRRR